jgi:signal transduction histidine kinase
VAAFYEPLAASRDIRLALRTELLDVPGDADLLGEALANLVDNAIKFTPPGGCVEIALAVEGDGAVQRVSDTGAGLRPGEHERVFERFYRAEETRALPGTGLGLSLVAAIVRLHGGRVRVSDNAPGTNFDLVLPLSAGGMQAP